MAISLHPVIASDRRERGNLRRGYGRKAPRHHEGVNVVSDRGDLTLGIATAARRLALTGLGALYRHCGVIGNFVLIKLGFWVGMTGKSGVYKMCGVF